MLSRGALLAAIGPIATQVPAFCSAAVRYASSTVSSSRSPYALDSRAPTDRLATGRPKPRAFDPAVPPQALTLPQQHPRIHGIPVAILHIRAFHHELLTLFIHFSLHAAYALGMPVSRAVSLPTQRSLYTVLRGPFVHKKSQENFERVVHKRAIKVWDTDPDVLSKWIRYLEINMMPGIGIRVVRWERAEVGFGAKKLQGIRDAQSELFKSREKFDLDTSSGRVKALADQIIKAEMASAAAAEAESASFQSGPASWLEFPPNDNYPSSSEVESPATLSTQQSSPPDIHSNSDSPTATPESSLSQESASS